jgi:hypothetical protein
MGMMGVERVDGLAGVPTRTVLFIRASLLICGLPPARLIISIGKINGPTRVGAYTGYGCFRGSSWTIRVAIFVSCLRPDTKKVATLSRSHPGGSHVGNQPCFCEPPAGAGDSG